MRDFYFLPQEKVMFDFSSILESMGINLGEVEAKVKEYAVMAREKLDVIDNRLARIERALNIIDAVNADFKELENDRKDNQ